MSVKFIKGDEFESNLTDGLTIVNFYADWCGPCKMFAPVLEEVANEGNITVLKLNVDDEKSKSIAKSYGVSGIPSTFFMRNKKSVQNETGYLPKEAVIEIIKGI